jgi:hypothetical protein
MTHQGWLHKRNVPISPPSMSRIYCVLWGTLLLDYDSEEESRTSVSPKVVSEILGISEWDGQGRANQYPNGFLLVTHTGGTYYLIVDGVSGSSGTFSLSATLSGGSTATGENCSSPIPLNFVGATAIASGTTATAVSDRASACGGSGADRVYSFTVSGTRTFSVTITPSSTHRPVVYITGPGTCSVSVTELTCMAATSTGLSATLPTQTLSSGTYFLWVDSWSGTSGTYTLNATLQ